MAWNKPTEREQGIGNREQGKSPFRGLVAGAVVTLGAAVAAWWLWPEGKSAGQTPPPRNGGLIKAVKPEVVATTNAAPKEKVRPYDDYDHETCYRDAQGFLRLKKSNARVHDPAVKYIPIKPIGDPSKAIFKRTSDRCIARLIMYEPSGTGIPDRRDYYSEAFQKDFMESLKSPEFVKEDDSDWVKSVKRATNEAKAEIMARIRAGEKLGDILTETRNEIIRLGEYRKSVMATLNDSIRGRSDLSDSDVETYIDAANKMLEEKGVKPIGKGSFMRWNVKLRNKQPKIQKHD